MFLERVGDRYQTCSDADQRQHKNYDEYDYDSDDHCDYAYRKCFQPPAVEEVLDQRKPNNEHCDVGD